MKPTKVAILLVILSSVAWSAAVTHAVSTASTTNASSYASAAFTPAASDLLVAMVSASDTIAPFPTMTDSQSLGFRLVASTKVRTGLDSIYIFVSNALAANSSMTVTFDCSGDAATGAIIQVARISSMTRTGFNAVRQTSFQTNQSSGGTPAPAFAVAALTGNPTLGVVMNATNPATMTTPTNWTERDDTGYSTPTTGAEYVSRDSGFTSTTVTWGSTSASAFGDIIIELDTSAASGEQIDEISHGTTALTGSSMTWNHTVTGTHPVIVVETACICLSISIIQSITYNGTALTKIDEGRDWGGSELFHQLWILPAPTTGTHAVLVTFSGALTAEIINGSAVSVTGVHQTYPYRNSYQKHAGTTTGTTMTATCTDAVSGDFVVGMGISHQSQIVANGGQIPIFTQNGFDVATNTAWGSAIVPAAIRNTITHTQAIDTYSASCVSLRPDTDTPTTPIMDNFAQTVGGLTSTTSTITNFVVGSGINRFLLVGAGYTGGTGGDSTTITGVTFGGVALSKWDSDQRGAADHKKNSEFWYLKSPAVSTANIVVTYSASVPEYGTVATSYFLVDQATPLAAVAKNGSSSLASVTVTVTTGTTGSLIQDISIRDDDSAPNGAFFETGGWRAAVASQTNGNNVAAQVKPGAASVVMNWTGNTSAFSMMGVPINFGLASVIVARHK